MTEHSWHFSDWEAALGISTDVALDDDVKVDEAKLSNRLCKTADEIERFSVDESLSEVEKAKFLIRNGARVQKLSVISNLRRLLLEYDAEAKNMLLPELLSVLAGEPADVQISCGRAFGELLQAGMLVGKCVAAIFPFAQKLLESNEAAVSEQWAEVIIHSIRHLPAAIIEKDILPQALAEGTLSQPSSHRIWCSRVVGALASRSDMAKFHDKIYRKAMTLCQDTEYEVRIAMCKQLLTIAKITKPSLAKRELIDGYLELLSDEENIVREAALTEMVQLLPIVDNDVKSTILIPLWRKLCADRSQSLMGLVAREFGRFVWESKSAFSEADWSYFLTTYCGFSTSNSTELRAMCAFNYPAMVASVGPELYEQRGLHSTIERMSQDSCADVRRKLAAGMHEVASILGKFSFHYLKTPVLRLFLDEDPEVCEKTYQNLDKVLSCFVADEIAHRNKMFDELLFIVLRKEREFASNSRCSWRTHLTLLQQFRNFALVFDSDHLHDHCIPLLLKIMTEDHVMQIKSTAIATVCLYVRKLRRLEQRERVIKQLVHELTTSRSYRTRMLFLDVCQNILDICSHRFFKEHFLLDFLNMARDSVPNVRLRMCRMLPQVKKTLHMPVDSGLTQKLNDVVGSLLTDDPDQDVTHAAHEVIERINNNGAGFLSNGSLQALSMVDCSDREKEEEERGVLAIDGEDEDGSCGSARDGAGGSRRDFDDARHDLTRRLAGGKDSGKDRHMTFKLAPKKVGGAALKPRSGPQVTSGGPSGVAGKVLVPSSLAVPPPKARERHGSICGPPSTFSSATSLSQTSLSLPASRQRGRSAGTSQAPGQQRSPKSPTEMMSSIAGGGSGGGGGALGTCSAPKMPTRWTTTSSSSSSSQANSLFLNTSVPPAAYLRRKSDTPIRASSRLPPPVSTSLSTSPRSSGDKLHTVTSVATSSSTSPLPKLRNAGKVLPPL